MIIDQSDIKLVEPGQNVSIRFDHLPGKTVTGEIVRIATTELDTVSTAMSASSGGRIPTVPDASGRARPQSAQFQAIVPLPVTSGALQSGRRGQAKIVVQSATLGSRLWRALQTTFRLNL